MNTTLSNLFSLAARVFLALIFIGSGAGKLADQAGTVAYMGMGGVPALLYWPTVIVELLGGVLVIVGYQTRLTAFILAGFTLLAAFLFHRNFADQIQMIMFLKNIAITGGFFLLVANGAGGWSVDGRK